MQINNEIIDRLDLLFSCLIFCSEVEPIFKPGERICINQERAALYAIINQTPDERSPYQVSETIEQKIQETAQKIKDKNWVRPEHDGPLE